MIRATYDFNSSELILLRRGLLRLRRDFQRHIRSQDAQGWKPEPGKRDANRFHLRHVDKLLKRFGQYDDDDEAAPDRRTR